MNTPCKKQTNNQRDVYNYFKSSINDASEEAKEELRKYVSRIELILSCSYSFNEIDLHDNEKETYVYMLKLSESWFSYEALLKVIQENGYKSEKPNTKKTKAVELKSIQDAIKLQKNLVDTQQPFGKPGFFNDLKITDSYLEVLIENELDYFKDYLDYIFQFKQEARSNVQKYIFYLENTSLGAQKKYLLESYNRLTVGPEITPVNVMSVAYAVRNQYVHDGEIIDSGIEDYQIKCELLKACYNFVVTYSLIIATQIMIDNYETTRSKPCIILAI